jgi:carbon-monoxide dehydrogenase small subunit
MERKKITLDVNDDIYEVEVYPNETLLEVLRDKLGYTGAKSGCDDGTCGACTILIDGIAVKACLTLAVEVEHKKIKTIEGIAQNGKLHPIQESFVKNHAIQCGYCTSGMIMSSLAAINEKKRPLTRNEAKEAISGNLCRCTGYVKIVDAIVEASEVMNNK